MKEALLSEDFITLPLPSIQIKNDLATSIVSDSQDKNVIQSNHLFPVFLKLEDLKVAIIGGGNVGLEKLLAVLNNSPATDIRLVAIAINDTIRHATTHHQN